MKPIHDAAPGMIEVAPDARCPLCGRRLADSKSIHRLRRRESVSQPYREVVVCGRELPPLWLLATWPRRVQERTVLAVWRRLAATGTGASEAEPRRSETAASSTAGALPCGSSLDPEALDGRLNGDRRPGMTTAAGAIVLVVGLSLTWAAVIGLMVRTLIH